MLNISKHYLWRNGDLLQKVCVACWNFAPQCMKLLGNLTIWPTALDWRLFGRVISTIAFRWLFSSNLKTSYHINSEYFGSRKTNVAKACSNSTPEDKYNKQKNQAVYFCIGNHSFSTDLIFRSQQMWDDKNHVSVQLWVKRCLIHLEWLLGWIIPRRIQRLHWKMVPCPPPPNG